MGWLLPALSGGFLADFAPKCIKKLATPSVHPPFWFPHELLVKIGLRLKAVPPRHWQHLRPPWPPPASPGPGYAWASQVAALHNFAPLIQEILCITMPPPAPPNSKPTSLSPCPPPPASSILLTPAPTHHANIHSSSPLCQLQKNQHFKPIRNSQQLYDFTVLSISPLGSPFGILTSNRDLDFTGRLHRSYACCGQALPVNFEDALGLDFVPCLCIVGYPVLLIESHHSHPHHTHPSIKSKAKITIVVESYYRLPGWTAHVRLMNFPRWMLHASSIFGLFVDLQIAKLPMEFLHLLKNAASVCFRATICSALRNRVDANSWPWTICHHPALGTILTHLLRFCVRFRDGVLRHSFGFLTFSILVLLLAFCCFHLIQNRSFWFSFCTLFYGLRAFSVYGLNFVSCL